MTEKTPISSRKSPKQERSRYLVGTILAAATRVFGKVGGKATTNRIAQVAGVSIGSLYQYFPNKDALVATLIRERVEGQDRALEALLGSSRGRPPDAVIAEMIGMIAADSLKSRTFMRTLYSRGVALEFVPVVVEFRLKAIGRIAAFLKENYGGTLRVTEVDRSVFYLIHAVLGVISAVVVSSEETPQEAETLTRDLTDMALKYLFVSGPR